MKTISKRLHHGRLAVIVTAFGVLCLAGLAGCEKRSESAAPSLTTQQDESEFVLAVVLDLSGSFTHQMANEGKAYEFALAVLDRYFRHRNGLNDKLILAQISGTHRSLLWQGSPLQLRQQFPTADSFREFLLQKADPGGSLVHEGLANVVNYVSADSRVTSGQAKSAIFCLSDCYDTAPDPTAGEQKLMQALGNYARTGGAIGLYYVDQTLQTAWQQKLQAAGFGDFVVECEIVGRPTLPDFDQ
jgi:hypothetical protein